MPSPTPLRVDIPLLPQSALGNALQFIDLLRVANTLARLRHGRHAPAFAWQLLDEHGRALPPDGLPPGFADYVASPNAGASAPLAVFLPWLQAADVPTIRGLVTRHGDLVERIGLALDAGGLVAACGNAAWLAAAGGRLDGEELALPWFWVAAFRRDFPGIRIGPGASVAGPRCASAATLHGLPALATHLVRRAMGEQLARACATALEPDPRRVKVAVQAAGRVPVTRAGALSRALRFLEERLEQPYDLQAVAAAAAVSPRTLLRHFANELGKSPLDALHGMRCERARLLLEITLESVPSIAVACGYADPTAFRRVFVRHCGMTPAAWRERHRLRAPRARWQVDSPGASR